MEDMTWTQPRSPTFLERMRLTYTLFSMRLPAPVVWLTILWSIGATVSFNLTDPRRASLLIESANGRKSVDVTVSIKRMPIL